VTFNDSFVMSVQFGRADAKSGGPVRDVGGARDKLEMYGVSVFAPARAGQEKQKRLAALHDFLRIVLRLLQKFGNFSIGSSPSKCRKFVSH